MPGPAYKSLVTTDHAYDGMFEIYKKKKNSGELVPGIASFSGYVVHEIEQMLKEKESLKRLASNIRTDKIPQKFTTTKILINPCISTPKNNHTIAKQKTYVRRVHTYVS